MLIYKWNTALEQQTSVFTPCVDVEENERGIESRYDLG